MHALPPTPPADIDLHSAIRIAERLEQALRDVNAVTDEASEELVAAVCSATDRVVSLAPETSAGWPALARYLINTREADMHLPDVVAAIEGYGRAVAAEVVP